MALTISAAKWAKPHCMGRGQGRVYIWERFHEETEEGMRRGPGRL